MDQKELEIIEERAERKEERRTYFRGFSVMLLINIGIIGGSFLLLRSYSFNEKKSPTSVAQTNQNGNSLSVQADAPAPAPVADDRKAPIVLPETWVESDSNDVNTGTTQYIFATKQAAESAAKSPEKLGNDDYFPERAITILANETNMPLPTYDNLYNQKADFDGVIIDSKVIADLEYRCLQRKSGEKFQIDCVAKKNNKDTLYRLNTDSANRDSDFAALIKVIESVESVKF